jgi:hypothetical protein
MTEKRITARNRVLKAGTIEFHGGGIDCTVRNLSRDGAALDVASPVGIPGEFMLFMSADRERHQCCVVWRKEKRIGVRFR